MVRGGRTVGERAGRRSRGPRRSPAGKGDRKAGKRTKPSVGRSPRGGAGRARAAGAASVGRGRGAHLDRLGDERALEDVPGARGDDRVRGGHPRDRAEHGRWRRARRRTGTPSWETDARVARTNRRRSGGGARGDGGGTSRGEKSLDPRGGGREAVARAASEPSADGGARERARPTSDWDPPPARWKAQQSEQMSEPPARNCCRRSARRRKFF